MISTGLVIRLTDGRLVSKHRNGHGRPITDNPGHVLLYPDVDNARNSLRGLQTRYRRSGEFVGAEIVTARVELTFEG